MSILFSVPYTSVYHMQGTFTIKQALVLQAYRLLACTIKNLENTYTYVSYTFVKNIPLPRLIFYICHSLLFIKNKFLSCVDRRPSEEHVAKSELLVNAPREPNKVYVGDSSGEDSM